MYSPSKSISFLSNQIYTLCTYLSHLLVKRIAYFRIKKVAHIHNVIRVQSFIFVGLNT